jgi:glycosyltransferase involved in cell wall biosynthesis
MKIAVMPHLPYWSIRTRGWQMAKALAAIPGVECHFLVWGTTELTIQSRLLRGLDTLRRAVTNLWPKAPYPRAGTTVHTLPILDTRLVSAGVPLGVLHAHNRLRLTRFLAELRPDWFLTSGGHAAPLKWGSGPPTALDLFDDHFEGLADLATFERLDPAAARAYRRVDLLMACSRGITRKYSRILGREVHYVPNGFDGPAGAATLEEKEAARRRYRLPLDAKIVGYVGNHGLHAGLSFLLRVASRLRERDNRVVVALAGPILDAAERRAAEAHAAVRVLGPIPPDDVPQFLGACDVGVLPTVTTEFRSHAMPLKILEYGARQLPAVATPLRELTIQNFPHVRLCPFDDVAAWTTAVEEALRSPFDPAWESAIDRFAWPRIATGLLALLRDAPVHR